MLAALLTVMSPAWGLDLGVEMSFTAAGSGDTFRWSCLADEVALGDRIPLPLGTRVPENRAAALRILQVAPAAVRVEVMMMDLFPQPEGYVVVDYLSRQPLPAEGLCAESEACMLSNTTTVTEGRLDVTIWPLPPLLVSPDGEAERAQVRQRSRWKNRCDED